MENNPMNYDNMGELGSIAFQIIASPDVIQQIRDLYTEALAWHVCSRCRDRRDPNDSIDYDDSYECPNALIEALLPDDHEPIEFMTGVEETPLIHFGSHFINGHTQNCYNEEPEVVFAEIADNNPHTTIIAQVLCSPCTEGSHIVLQYTNGTGTCSSSNKVGGTLVYRNEQIAHSDDLEPTRFSFTDFMSRVQDQSWFLLNHISGV